MNDFACAWPDRSPPGAGRPRGSWRPRRRRRLGGRIRAARRAGRNLAGGAPLRRLFRRLERRWNRLLKRNDYERRPA
jgi:hypothetical protein